MFLIPRAVLVYPLRFPLMVYRISTFIYIGGMKTKPAGKVHDFLKIGLKTPKYFFRIIRLIESVIIAVFAGKLA